MITPYILAVAAALIVVEILVLMRLVGKGLGRYAFYSVVFFILILLKLPFYSVLFYGIQGWLVGPDIWVFTLYYWIFLAYHLLAFFFYPIFLLSEFLSLLRRPSDVAQKNTKSRKRFLRDSLSGIGAGFPLVVGPVWGVGMSLSRLEIDINEVSIRIKRLHPDLDGYRICQISDLHAGVQIQKQYLDHVSGLVKKTRSDILVVTGDIIDTNNYYLAMVCNFFHSLRGSFKDGIYGVTGNHDYFDDGNYLIRMLRHAGVRMLCNQNLIIKRGRGEFELAGLDSPFRYQNTGIEYETILNRSLKRIQFNSMELPVVLLAHDPGDFIRMCSAGIDLVMAGHTHGGQVDFSHRSESHILAGRYYRGHYFNGEQQLYVNSGTASWLKTRVNVPAEITVLNLRQG